MQRVVQQDRAGRVRPRVIEEPILSRVESFEERARALELHGIVVVFESSVPDCRRGIDDATLPALEEVADQRERETREEEVAESCVAATQTWLQPHE